ncbi:hypothetical protein AVEN_232817-1 [Araneus ventricosus]|uniref:Uncharacterized protein n=1 Tax=Araneus ventricosus TaxID=182803 RepID=A0A4Y2GSX7_ARAVE|nr:hypothetical protein AVEN_232817-1 [Araneus ventricosus]
MTFRYVINGYLPPTTLHSPEKLKKDYFTIHCPLEIHCESPLDPTIRKISTIIIPYECLRSLDMLSMVDCHQPPSIFERNCKIKLWQSPSSSTTVNSTIYYAKLPAKSQAFNIAGK